MTLERCKVAYQKLNEITQTRIFRGPANNQFHTLVQLHCMMNDLYCDFQVSDIRELYEVLVSNPQSGFQCLNHAQHGMVVLYNEQPMLVRSPPTQQQMQSSPPLLFNNNNATLQQNRPLQQHNNNSSSSSASNNALFGSMS
jgi:hypothetical protein